MKHKIKISRKNLAAKNFNNVNVVITGTPNEFPDKAERIASVIKNILLKEDIKNVTNSKKFISTSHRFNHH